MPHIERLHMPQCTCTISHENASMPLKTLLKSIMDLIPSINHHITAQNLGVNPNRVCPYVHFIPLCYFIGMQYFFFNLIGDLKMFTLEDVENIEVNDCDSDTFYRSIQRAINDGLWSLQGSYGRTMMEAIDNGCCLLGKKQFTDYYGNIIPSRFQVTSKTKGSMEFVKKTMGKDWLDMMVEL